MSRRAARVRFLVNPSSGRGRSGRHVGELRTIARRHGADLVVSESAQHLRDEACRAADDRLERLVVAGGDGTFHYVLQDLAGSDCALGLIPTGRGNDLASTLGAPAGIAEAARHALEGPTRTIDLGTFRDCHFAVHCGGGFDSEAGRHADSVRWIRGPLAYPYSVLCTLARFEPTSFEIEHDAGSFSGRAMFALVANCPRFGGGMQIAPDAKPNDGLLELIVVREVSKLELLRVFPKVYSGTHVDHPAVTIVQTKRARIDVERALPLLSDGELQTELEPGGVEIGIRPAALRVVSELDIELDALRQR